MIEKIGSGGMGSVWRAKQDEPVQWEVALKLICLFQANTAVGSGGAIFSNQGCRLDVRQTAVIGNQAWSGSAVYARTQAYFGNCTIAGNMCEPYPEQPFGPDGTLTFGAGEFFLDSCTIVENKSSGGRSVGISVSPGAILELLNTIVAGNRLGAEAVDF